MRFNILRSLLRRERCYVASPSMADIGHASSQEAPAAQHGLGAIGRRIDEIYERLAQLDKVEFWRYQAEATSLLERILAQPRYDDPLRLERFGLKVYSQNDEDGIIAEIFRRIGTTNTRFLEFGVENGLENNTLLLLEQGWSGAWLEGSRDHVCAIESGFRRKIDAARLSVRQAVVNRDNINDLVRALALPHDLDLLSIDIDGNDYHIWDAITAIEPRMVVIEYNAKFPPPMQWLMDYDPAHRWDGTDQFGASLATMADLGRRKGYRLVGCNVTGSNAFFVQAALAERRFAEPADAVTLYQPARYFLTPAFFSGHPPGYDRSPMR
ncbi:MAG TPA: hypothetical protein VGQ54_17340 [Burkholderiales bacterium]|nr:hypothetical protein [Burkholderiales bacterium]